MQQTRQATLTLVEKVVTETCGVQKQESYDAIANAVDEYVDMMLHFEQVKHATDLENLKTFATQMV